MAILIDEYDAPLQHSWHTSVMNNICNISFDPRFTTVCGITEQEITDNFQPELHRWPMPMSGQ